MGKQTQRQHARLRTVADMPDEKTDTCCLPHGGEAGLKLGCNHFLCSLDLLKLIKFSTQLLKPVITCPMCRKMEILDELLVSKAVNEQPFKCAVFKCACTNSTCSSFTAAVLRPCKAHGNYLCVTCPGAKNGAHLHTITRGGEGTSDTPDWSVPGWGMDEEEFLDSLTGFRQRSATPLTPADILILRAARAGGFNPYPA